MEGEIEARVARPSVISNFSGETTGRARMMTFRIMKRWRMAKICSFSLPQNLCFAQLEIWAARKLGKSSRHKKVGRKSRPMGCVNSQINKGQGAVKRLDSRSLGLIFYAHLRDLYARGNNGVTDRLSLSKSSCLEDCDGKKLKWPLTEWQWSSKVQMQIRVFKLDHFQP